MADQALEVKDFSGGMTDNHIGAPLNKAQALLNYVIRPDTKAETRPGCSIFNASYYQVPYVTSAKRVDSFYRFKDSEIYQTMGKLYHINSAWVEITGPTSNSAFSSSVAQLNQCSYAEWNNHLVVTNDYRTRPMFVYKDGSDFKLRNVGLPLIASSGVTMGSTGAASRSYIFVNLYQYTIDGVDFEMRGPPSEPKTFTGTLPNSISTIPVLANGSSDNYHTTSIKVEIYRTADAGSVYYKVGEVTNGTTTFNDTTVDADLEDGLILYTDADDLDYTQPPKCKYVVQHNGAMYYLNIEDSNSDVYPYRLIQAAPDQIYAANEGNVCDFDEDITGGAVAGQNVLVFTKNRTYRLEGAYDSTGRGGIFKTEVSRTIGCISHKSIVQTLEGVFFAGIDGFYFTDGYRVVKISEDLPDTYLSSVTTETMQKRIYGAYDPYTKRVYWGACSDSDATDNDVIYVAHLYFGVRPDTPFTIWDGGSFEDNFFATALYFYNGQLLRGDRRGYVLAHEDGTLNDAKISTSVAPASWNILPVIYEYRSVATDFGTSVVKKWVPKLNVYVDPTGKVTIQPYSNNDNTGNFRELAEIRSETPVLWEEPGVLWGDEDIRWNYIPIASGLRRMPSGGLRCSYKQIKFTNSYTLIEDSTSAGTVSVNSTTKAVTLNNASLKWDVNAVDYYLSFSDDDYTLEFKVTTRNSDTVLTVEDPDDLLVTNATASFKLRGYRKNEAHRLLSYSLLYQPLSPTQSPYRAS